MRILYPFPEPFPLPKARGIQVANTVDALAREDMHVDFAYVPTSDKEDPFAHYGLSKQKKITVHPFSRNLPRPLNCLPIRSGSLFRWRLNKWIERVSATNERPHVVLVRHLKLAYALLKTHPGYPIVYEAHEIFSDGASSSKAKRLARMEKEVLEKSAEIIVITGALGRLLQKRYGITRPMTVIPSATSRPQALSNKDWANARQHIVYSGSLYGWKGTQDLVAAAQWLPGYKITLIGGEPHSIQALREKVPHGGAEIEFCGHVSHAEVQRRLAEACIAVLPNRAGSVSAFTSPLKLFEYMAAGCAIVTTDLPVFREVLAEEDARWAPPEQPKALADAIRACVESPGLAEKLGKRMHQIAAQYTWQARGTRLREVLERAVASHRPCSSLQTDPR
ncbi:glycosyltransferase family 4 protein [Propionivibrio sp.]|uniref:glycosyltransferase family 4 protein n=1 Tax=Propionivibrio sp. TaxID=2212460 RepID=UPI003BF32EB4